MPPTSGQPRAETAAAIFQAFQQAYGREPQWMAAAPGRVNLIGEHIDYCDGFVMPFALPTNAVAAAAVAPGRRTVRIRSRDLPGEIEFDPAAALEPGEPSWANYPVGVFDQFARRGKVPSTGLDILVGSDVPVGAGLSSSAALEVATATLLTRILAEPLDVAELAQLCQRAENEFAGVPCGVMDQFASAAGAEDRLVLLDCRSLEFERVPFEASDPALCVLVANTGVSHSLNDGGYASRRAQVDSALAKIGKESWRDAVPEDLEHPELDDIERRRSRHVIGEIARTQAAAEALRANDFAELGRLMEASHASLRDDFEVSCPELDFLVEQSLRRAASQGVLGARMTGGGFGGSIVILCPEASSRELSAELEAAYRQEFDLPLQVLLARPSAGAAVLEV